MAFCKHVSRSIGLAEAQNSMTRCQKSMEARLGKQEEAALNAERSQAAAAMGEQLDSRLTAL